MRAQVLGAETKLPSCVAVSSGCSTLIGALKHLDEFEQALGWRG